ncbi:MAG: DUF3718 domain-containing protein [Gammaproteobacteria bacterium]|nr:DUF3718 domain-containing protein [Gammaproteobacteria bacterium]
MYHITLKIIFVLILISSQNIYAGNNELERSYSFNKANTKLCHYAKNNQLLKFRRTLRQARYHIKAIYPAIDCDGKTLTDIAINNQSTNIIKYLDKYSLLDIDVMENAEPLKVAAKSNKL